MPIRFKCRHCKKALAVKDHIAGRKVICPGCRKVIVIPSPKPSAAQVEELAAAMLGDGDAKKETKPKPVEAKPIKFRCEFCDEETQVPATEAGKKMPCPECKRIIRIPVPHEDKPKDWREVLKKGPSAAKNNQPEQIENAWGTEQTRSVTRQALVEADAIPTQVEPISPIVWVKRGIWGTITVTIVGMVFVGIIRARSESVEKQALKEALTLAPKLPPEWAAEIHRAAGELHCAKRKPLDARKEFRIALASLQRSQKPGVEVDLFLIDLALAQIELGGSEDEIMSKERISWPEVQRDVSQTLDPISEDARGLAHRLVGTRLADKKQILLAIGIAGSAPIQQHGLSLAHKAAQENAATDPDKAVRQEATRTPVDNKKQAGDKFSLPKGDEPIDPQARIAHVEGLARQRKYKEALVLAWDRRQKEPVKSAEETAHCLKACVSGAELALANKNSSEAVPFVQKAVTALKELQAQPQGLVPKWLIFATMRAGIEANVGEVQELSKSLDPVFQPCIKLISYRQKLAKATAAVTEVDDVAATAKEHRDLLCWPLTWQALARHNARHRTGRDDILALGKTAEDDRLRAFLLVGFALGHHD